MKKRKITTLSLEGIPQPIARGLAAMVDTLRDQLANRHTRRNLPRLHTKHGRVIGNLHRRDLYGDVL